LCIRAQAIMFEDMALHGVLNDTLRVACLSGVAGLRTLGGTYRIGDTDGDTADAIFRIAFVLSCLCREPKKHVTTQTQTPPHQLLPSGLALSSSALASTGDGTPARTVSTHPPLPPSPPTGKAQTPMMFGRSHKRRGAGVAASAAVTKAVEAPS